jgi:hypothetical protein
MKYIAFAEWKDGGETTMASFVTESECLAWIAKQPQPVGDEFVWCVGEYLPNSIVITSGNNKSD